MNSPSTNNGFPKSSVGRKFGVDRRCSELVSRKMSLKHAHVTIDDDSPALIAMIQRESCYDASFPPILRLLRVFGFFPGYCNSDYCNEGFRLGCSVRARNIKRLVTTLWTLLSMFYMAICLWLLYLNYLSIKFWSSYEGVLHVRTLTALLTGMKPLQGFFNLIAFVLAIEEHKRFLMILRDTSVMHVRSIFFKRLFVMIIICFIALVTCTAMLAQYILMEQILGESWIMDLSLILVPLMSIWQILPVVYYVYICIFLKHFFKTLRERLVNDLDLTKKSLGYYFDSFNDLTKATFRFSQFIGPAMLFGLGTSIIVMCLTTYFLIYADLALEIPENATKADIWGIRFIPMWAGLQIATAFGTMLAYIVAGFRVNEMARSIMMVLMRINPTTGSDRYLVMKFGIMIRNRETWQVSAMRFIQMERTLILSILSLIAGYALILVKMANG